MRIQATVGLRLSHYLGNEPGRGPEVGSTVHFYGVQTVMVERPARGSRTGRARCVTCGEWVPFRVRGKARTRRRKCVKYAAALLGLSLCYLAMSALIRMDAQDDVSSTGADLGLLAVAACGFLGGLTGAVLGLIEDGITKGGSRLRGLTSVHMFKTPKVLRAMRRPRDRDIAHRLEIEFDDNQPQRTGD
ncbi:hypothetical protein DSC45_02675 [Streptomyces sp. YIM 130001]|uniref:hypothetical protein n=1 Tax=Streptomyces sp. YIM 130001 TaxID=2259644 RepID=UPI000E658698|nr:hypothetical protein [Streptomyces sp. YIM 130001]RII20725.1 hypothetical protein DSC45_02675 [Streptomyces sp. YIM 130001]